MILSLTTAAYLLNKFIVAEYLMVGSTVMLYTLHQSGSDSSKITYVYRGDLVGKGDGR